jgi:hypothetical protein
MKWPFLFFIIFFTIGCGIKKLAVKHADYFIYHQVSKWLPINSKQKKEIYQDIKNFLNNSKDIAKNINSVIDEIDLKDEKNIEKNYLILESIYSQILKDFMKIISSQLSKIDPKQQKVFFEKLEDHYNKIKRKTREEKIKALENHMKNLLGKIEDDQKNLIKSYGDYLYERDSNSQERRIKISEKLLQVFSENISQELKKENIENALLEYQLQTIRGNKNLEFLKNLAPTITPKQKAHLDNHLKQIKEILNLYIETNY